MKLGGYNSVNAEAAFTASGPLVDFLQYWYIWGYGLFSLQMLTQLTDLNKLNIFMCVNMHTHTIDKCTLNML